MEISILKFECRRNELSRKNEKPKNKIFYSNKKQILEFYLTFISFIIYFYKLRILKFLGIDF